MKEGNLSRELREVIEKIRRLESIKTNQRITKEIEQADTEREVIWDLGNTISLLFDDVDTIHQKLYNLKRKSK